MDPLQTQVLLQLVETHGLSDVLRAIAQSLTTVTDSSGPNALSKREQFHNRLADALEGVAQEAEYFVE